MDAVHGGIGQTIRRHARLRNIFLYKHWGILSRAALIVVTKNNSVPKFILIKKCKGALMKKNKILIVEDDAIYQNG